MQPVVHYDVGNSLTFVPVVTYSNPVHALPSHFFKICLILTPYLCLGFPSDLFPSVSPPKPCMQFSSHPYMPYTLSLYLLDHPNI